MGIAIAVIAIVVVGACRITGSSKGDVDARHRGFATFRNRMLPVVLSAAAHDKEIARF